MLDIKNSTPLNSIQFLEFISIPSKFSKTNKYVMFYLQKDPKLVIIREN